MPVYNTEEKFLREAIESILVQTFGDFEFIIIDDGSTNNVPEILEEYKNKDSRIVILKGEHKGIPCALNLGLGYAKGDYVARMDSDDLALPYRFEKQINYLEENKDVSLLGAGIEQFPNKKIIKHKKDISYLDLLNKCCIAHPTVMFRRADFEKFNLRYNEECMTSEDYELWSRVVKHLKIENLQEILLKYRHLDHSSSHKNTNQVFESDREIRQRMIDNLTQDKKLQNKIYDVLDNHYKEKFKFTQQLFSIRNAVIRNQKYKMIIFLGIRFYIKK